MRKLYFLLPGTGGKFACGGLWAELKTFDLVKPLCPTEVVTYRQREPNTLFLQDVLRSDAVHNAIFVVSWGFDVAKLVPQLLPHPVVYHAHSTGYGFRLPSRVPIWAVSRHTLGYWGQRSPHAPLYYLPNQISEEFRPLDRPRDIDVLVQARKSSTYLLQTLIPALEQSCNVCVIRSHVDDLAGLFNRAKIYLYDSAEYWAQQGVSEGFGLQPLEAMACGCDIFSSTNGGLADYLDPGLNSYKIAGYSVDYDVQRIQSAIQSFPQFGVPNAILAEHRRDAIQQRLSIILSETNEFFDHLEQHPSSIPELTAAHLLKLKVWHFWNKFHQRMKAR